MFTRKLVSKVILPALVLLVLAASRNLRPARGAGNAGEEGFTPLFNGKDLAGWTGDPDLWKVENGEIIGNTKSKQIKHNTFLATEKKYSDFVLKGEVKLLNGNSGIQFRSEQHPDYVVKGYQADVAETVYTGMLYEEGKRGILPYWNAMTKDQQAAVFANAKPLGEWNEYVITCKGNHVKLDLNGKTTCDLDDPEGGKEGIVALQLHVWKDGMEVHFRNLRIKELK
ncbi:DUF1080 domain-containing protein [Candidatus Sumerlaeota bacterium]|nr:DUF1080 domain-containing protein [Candidatus Sumerlaeota bacterium]